MWKILRNVTFIAVVSCSSLVIAAQTEMSLIGCGETSRTISGKKGVALSFKRIDPNDPGNPLWEAKVMFTAEKKTNYIPYKTGVVGVIGALAAPPLTLLAIGVTTGKYFLNKADYFDTPSNVTMLYSIRNQPQRIIEEDLFQQHLNQSLTQGDRPFRREERQWKGMVDYLLKWENVPFEHLYQIADIVDKLRTRIIKNKSNKNDKSNKKDKREFPYYTSKGLSYLSDGLNCSTFCVRFLSKVPGIDIDDVDSLKIYSNHQNVTLTNHKLFFADSEEIIEQLVLNRGAVGNPVFYKNNINALYPKLERQIKWDNIN